MKGIAAYQDSAVTTQSKGRLIVLLYDGAIKFMKLAIKELEANKKANEETLQTEKKKLDSLSADFEESQKKPLVDKIVDASIKLELFKEADKQAKVDELMKEPVSSLELINASYQAMVGKIDIMKTAPTKAPGIRYQDSYQASKEEKETEYQCIKNIRQKMGAS